MKKVFNECVDCPIELGCMGDSCPHKNVIRFFCDDCKEENQLYRFDDKELCIDCIEKKT